MQGKLQNSCPHTLTASMQRASTVVQEHMPFKPPVICRFWVILWKILMLGDFLANSNEILFFVVFFFFSPDSPMMYLVLQQDPNIENVGLISKG